MGRGIYNTSQACYGELVKAQATVFEVIGSNPAVVPFFFEMFTQIKHIVS